MDKLKERVTGLEEDLGQMLIIAKDLIVGG